MKNILAAILIGFTAFLIGLAVSPNGKRATGFEQREFVDVSIAKDDLSQKVFHDAVWNKINPPDVSVAAIESAGPGGHVYLKLSGVHAAENIDNVQVFFRVAAALSDGSVKDVRSHVASIILESVPQKGTDLQFDVTPYFTFILSHSPAELRNFTVEFVQVPKNNGVKQTDQSFNIDWTYLEVTDAQGKPVPQEKREPRYG